MTLFVPEDTPQALLRNTAQIVIPRIAKMAAVLFALYFTYMLKTDFLAYATEPKVIGGIDLDRPIPQFMLWSPVYYPMLLAGLFAYWSWPKRQHQSLTRSVASGSFAIFRIELFGLFVSILCPGLGALYLAFPLTLQSEILPLLAGTIVSTVQTTAFMGVFLAMPIIGCSLVVGGLIALGARTASKHLPSSANETKAAVQSTEAAVRLPSNSWRTWQDWPSFVAALTVSAIMLAGFSVMGFWIFTFWVEGVMKVAIPCIALGAAIGSITKRWAWCVAISLPIGFYLSTTHHNSAGIFTSQSIDFPPVLFAVSAGFGLARKLVAKFFIHQRV